MRVFLSDLKEFSISTEKKNMQLGVIGLGRMGANIVRRLMKNGHECVVFNRSPFQRSDNVELGWSVVTPILDVWKALPPRNFPNYAARTWGSIAADDLLLRDGRQWRTSE
jgi:glucose-6-phosphate 1-dehydrogenase